MKHDPNLPVEGDGSHQHLAVGLGETDVTDAAETHALLEGSEGCVDLSPPPGDEPIVEPEPGRKTRMVLVRPAHQPGLDAAVSAAVRGRGYDRPHRRAPTLVAADQRVGRFGVVDVGRRGDQRADQARASSTPTWAL